MAVDMCGYTQPVIQHLVRIINIIHSSSNSQTTKTKSLHHPDMFKLNSAESTPQGPIHNHTQSKHVFWGFRANNGKNPI